MQNLLLFLQSMFHFVKALAIEIARRVHHHGRIFLTACSMIGMILMMIGESPNSTNRMDILAETPAVTQESTEPEEKAFRNTENEKKTEERIEDSKEYGGLVVGYLLTQNIKQQEEARQEVYARIKEVKNQIHKEIRAEEKAIANSSTVISCSPEDYQVLLKIVEAEAGICDEKGKILVANVIMNRVRSDQFPDTITGVVYQPSQFSPVSNGSINSCKVTSQTVECVKRALLGEDYSQGALYFMNRKASQTGAVSWFEKRLTYLFRHQGHEFFK